MKIQGIIVDILCELDPLNKDCVVYENVQKVLYVHIKQAIFKVNETSASLPSKKAEQIQKFRTQGLSPAIAYPTTRVRDPNQD